VLAAGALSAFAFACDGDRRAAEARAAAVRQEFLGICRELRLGSEPYFGEGPARELAARTQSPEGIERAAADPVAHVALLVQLGAELLELGRAEDTVRLLEGFEVHEPPRPGKDPSAESRSGEATPELSASAAFRADAGPLSPDERGDALDSSLRIRHLAVLRNAHLQAGEDQNCVLDHSASSCILPFQEEALHALPDHARRAGDLSAKILEQRPASISARWLLNLARMVSADHPEGVPESLRLPPDAFRSVEAFPRWRDRASEVGVDAVDLAGGAILDDFDGDGLLDVVSSTADHCGSLKAFRNDGRGAFEDVTRAWGLDAQLGGLNLVHADYDGDGRLDLLVLRGGWLGEYGEIRNSLLRNELADGGGRFVDVTREAGLGSSAHPSQTAAWGDYDGDGDLDVYVGNEAWGDRRHPSQLFRNEGDGTFRDVSAEAGVTNDRFAKGVAWGDGDDDGDLDLYVSNVGPNRYYRNEGDGHFTDRASELGLELPGRTFATWFFDYDNDGRLDLFVADYAGYAEQVMAAYMGVESEAAHPLVFHNEPPGFREVSRELGITQPTLPMGGNFGDIDGDGWLDIYLGTGNPRFEVLIPNLMLRNRAGVEFVDVSFAGGFAHLQKGHGVAFGDVDNDGDQDLFHQLGGFYPGDDYANALFENPGKGSGSKWITLRLEGTRANRFGVGARIAVRLREGGAVRTLHRVAGSGGSFGGSSMQQEIGLGNADAIEAITIRWPGSGTHQQLSGVEMNRIYRVVEGSDRLLPVAAPRIRLGGAAGRSRHVHEPDGPADRDG
jgi:hypothetical protein